MIQNRLALRGELPHTLLPTPRLVDVSPPPTASQPVPSVEQSRWFADEVHPHDGQLKAYLRGNFPGVRDVDDVVQESYLRIWKARVAHPIQSAKAFLFQIARHLAFDHVRENLAAPVEALSDLAAVPVLEDSPDAAEQLTYHEKVALLSDALSALPPRCRQVVMLRKIKNCSIKEVAAQLGLSERTVENQLARGLKRTEAFLRKRGVTSLFGDE